jgi:hypothetical protein
MALDLGIVWMAIEAGYRGPAGCQNAMLPLTVYLSLLQLALSLTSDPDVPDRGLGSIKHRDTFLHRTSPAGHPSGLGELQPSHLHAIADGAVEADGPARPGGRVI